MLRKLGYRCDIASNGQEAADMMARMPYDLVLMDCQMPEMDGYTASQVIREAERDSGRHTPIIAMTANAMREDRARCLEAGMDGFIPKPIALEELETALDCWVPPDFKPARNALRSAKVQAATHCAIRVDSDPMGDPGRTQLSLTDEATESARGADSVDLSVLAMLAEMADGGKEFVRGLVRTFITDSEARLAALREAIATGNSEQVERTAHALKGSSANMGAAHMASLAGLLQTAGKEKKLRDAGETAAQLADEFERARVVMTRLFEGRAAAA